MAQRLTVTPEEAADRLAIKELIDGYAHCADRRDAEGQMALFTEDTRFLVFMDSRDPNPSQTIVGWANLKPVFDNLRQYEATTHFNGQSTILLSGAVAYGRELLHRAPRPGRESPQPNGGVDPLSRQVSQREWALAL